MDKKEKFKKILEEIHKETFLKRDFELSMNHLRMDGEGRLFSIDKQGNRGSLLTDFAMTQLFNKMDMPVRYMKKLLEVSPELVAEQFNLWASRQPDDRKVLIRGKKLGSEFLVRGVLSDRYTIVDNKDVLESLVEITDEMPDFDVISVYHDDKKLHVRIAFPDLSESFGTSVEGKDDIIRVGIDIVNSEVGYSSLVVAPITYRLVCTNGLKLWKREAEAFRQRHVYLGREEMMEMLKVSLDRSLEKGKELIEGMRKSREVKVENPYHFIDNMVLQFNLSKKMGDRIKEAFEIEPERNMFGIVNAFTRAAQKVNSHDGRLQLETIASEIMLKEVA